MIVSLEHKNREESAGPQIAVQTMAAAVEGQVMEWGGGTVGREREKLAASGFPPDTRKETGSRIHLFSFTVSVLLTVLAFGVALYGELPADLLVPFLMLMAALQLFLQLIHWTRLKSRNDLLSILSLAFGTILTLVAMGAALYWVWI